MNFEDERYVRFFTRDTVNWLTLSFEAQGLFGLLIRKVDRAGVLDLGGAGKRGAAVVINHGTRGATILPALDELIAAGSVVINEGHLIIPRFTEAQEAVQSDKLRQSESRARHRAKAMTYQITKRDGSVTQRDKASRKVADPSRGVTGSHAASRGVTLASPVLPSDPSRLAVPTTTLPPALRPAVSASPSADPSWKEICTRIHEHAKKELGAPNLKFGGREAGALKECLGVVGTIDAAERLVTRLAGDDWVRTTQGLAWMLGPEGRDRGTRAASTQRNGHRSTASAATAIVNAPYQEEIDRMNRAAEEQQRRDDDYEAEARRDAQA
jgi:hypothetical protein